MILSGKAANGRHAITVPSEYSATCRKPLQWSGSHFLDHELALALALTQGTMNRSQIYFDHEKLVAYQRSFAFVAWASQLVEELPARLAVADQLDRASTSVPLNIAEGNAKSTAPDRCRAGGPPWNAPPAWMCSSRKEDPPWTEPRKENGFCLRRSPLLIGLCRSVSPDRLGEETAPYKTPAGD